MAAMNERLQGDFEWATEIGKRATGDSESRRFKAHFEEFRPVLAGDKEAVGGGVVGETIEDIGVRSTVGVGQESEEIDQTDHVASAGRDAGDGVALPDVRVNFSTDEFELVE